MAGVTADTVQVDMEVDISTYIANLRKADQAFTQVMNKLEAEATSTSAAFSTIRIPPADTGGVDNLNQSLGKTNLQVGNLAAQFNDIGVQLAGGQSPFLIALQQGTQINQVLGQAGAVGTVKALGAAFASMISPVSLATIAVIALGGAAIQWLATLAPKVETANEAISRHRTALEDIVDGYDEARTALDQYISAAGQLPRGLAIFELQKQFEQINKETADFVASLDRFASDQTFTKYGSEAILTMQDLAGQFSSGQINAEEFYRGLEDVKGELNLLERAGAVIPGSTQAMIDAWQQGALKAIAFGNAINQVVAASHALAGVAQDQTLAAFFDDNSVDGVIDTLKSLTPELRTQQQIIEDTYTKALGNPALTEAAREQLTIAKESAIAAVAEQEARKLADEAARQGASTAKQSAAEKRRELEAVTQLIDQLEFEYSLLGLSNEQRAVEVALRQAGAAATDTQRQRIEELIVATEEQAETLKLTEEAYKTIQDASESAVKGFVSDILDGKNAVDSLNDALKNLANRLATSFLDNAVGQLFGGGGGGGGNILSLFGIKPKAKGGPVSSGSPYLVGERGPELFVPSSAGNITSNANLRGMGGGEVTNNVFNYGTDKVQTRQNDTGGVDVIIGAVEKRIKENMGRGKYRQFGVSPALTRT